MFIWFIFYLRIIKNKKRIIFFKGIFRDDIIFCKVLEFNYLNWIIRREFKFNFNMIIWFKEEI